MHEYMQWEHRQGLCASLIIIWGGGGGGGGGGIWLSGASGSHVQSELKRGVLSVDKYGLYSC